MLKQTHFDVIDLFVVSLKERFEPTYAIYAALECPLLCIINGDSSDENGMESVRETYSDDVDNVSVEVKMQIFKQLFKDIPTIVCF